MLNRLPRNMPSLSMMLDDIGDPSNKAVGCALGVTEDTVRRWRKQGHAPKAAMLALFWLTRWGRSLADAEAHNDAVLYGGLARARLTRMEELERVIRRLGRIANFGSANDPVPEVRAANQVAQDTERVKESPGQPSTDDGLPPALPSGSTTQPGGLQQG